MLHRSIIVAGSVALLLVACASQKGELATDTASPSPEGEIGRRSELIGALQEAGVTLTPMDEVVQPFFDVPGQGFEMHGGELHVYEYPTEAARRDDSDKISSDGYSIGNTQVSWMEKPNFWAQGRIIVLYLGTDPEVIRLLGDVLGEPITSTPDIPLAVTEAQQHLSAALDTTARDMEIVSFEHVQWRNGCLELAKAGEMCTQVITPGWRVVLRAKGEQYVVHTDEGGRQIRVEGDIRPES